MTGISGHVEMFVKFLSRGIQYVNLAFYFRRITNCRNFLKLTDNNFVSGTTYRRMSNSNTSQTKGNFPQTPWYDSKHTSANNSACGYDLEFRIIYYYLKLNNQKYFF